MAMAAGDREYEERLQRLMAEVEASGPSPMQTPESTAVSQPRKGFWGQLKGNFWLPLQILAIPWTQEMVDQIFFGGHWNWVLYPRTLEGLPGIFLSAFSHGNFAHLIGNSIAFAIFSWLILAKNRRDYWITFGMGWLGGGLASWLLGPQSVHGLSGVVYALFGYLLVIGWLERRLIPLLISVFVLINYSATIWGIFPTQPMVAWWGHLFGLILGVFTAFGVYREPKQLKG